MEKHFFGALPPKIDKRDYKLAAAAGSEIFPEEFELNMGEIKDQGSVSSCVAHSAAEIVEYFNKKQDDIKDKISVGYIYGTRYDYKGAGMYLRDALKTLQKKGVCENEQFPYNKEVPEIITLLESKIDSITGEKENKITSYFSVNGTEEIKRALINYGPVMISVKWYDNIKVENGVMTTDFSGSYGYHCILITGWDEKGWKIMNSWGKHWGDNGYAVLPYSFPIAESWGITDDITRLKEDIVVPKNNSILNVLYKILNFILNLIKEFEGKGDL